MNASTLATPSGRAPGSDQGPAPAGLRRAGRTALALACGAALLLAAGCLGPDPGSDDYDGADIEVQVPSEAEADAAAAKRIHAGNADAEYQKLLEELDEEP
jgi:hypothetical protein